MAKAVLRQHTRSKLEPSNDLTVAPPKAESKPVHRNLRAAKAAKQDEFYTQYIDIQKEVEAYLEFDPDTFRGKIVYCNCDDPFESNFFKYFAANFNKLGLKKLVTTSYDGSPIAGAQLTFGEYVEGNGKRQKPKAVAIEIEEVKDINGDGATGIDDVKLFLERNPHSRTPLAQGGDFRSAECLELLTQADIVVTNPPFSLFREYVSLLVEHGKRFLIIGNTNSITYKEIFRLIKENKIWLGCTNFNVGMFFEVPAHWERFHHINQETGRKIARVSTSCWYTNLEHGRHHQKLSLMTMAENLKFSKNLRGKAAYERYDNYDAIEVSTYKEIPSDYEGAMGVPITFLDKYNPDQFEILGWTRGLDEFEAYPTKRYVNPKQIKPDGTVSNGGKLNTGPNLVRHTKPTGTYYTADNADGYLEQLYMRIIIRRKGTKK